MKIFDYETDEYVDVNGTSLKGTISTTFDKLCEVFGDPTYTEADPREKVACEWKVSAHILDDFADDEEDSTYENFTVYCWKEGRIPTETYDWHIGGYNYNAVDIAQRIIDGDTARAQS